VKTGFFGLDKEIVGLNMSEVTILSGSNSSGKSSWLNTLILNIIQQGFKVALWSGELRPDILKAWIQMVAAGKRWLKPSQYGDGKYFVPNNIAEKVDEWMNGKFFLYNNEYGNTWEQIFHDMTELLKAGVKVFILDNLFSLNIDLLEGDKNNKQRELILQVKDFAKKNQVHIILVAHPRKVTTFLRKTDISGSSDLTNAVDNVFIIHRVNQDFFRSGAEFFGNGEIQKFQGFGNVLEVAKNRMYGVVDYLVGFHYEIESRRFKNTMDEEMHYGWEQKVEQSAMPFIKDEPPQTSGMPFDAPTLDEAPF
jgi:KaiC/GvpD/RAD55 family RecA-like ATPase